MISSAAQSTPRARLALARASTTSVARQTRQYRYGPWQVETDQQARGRCHRSVQYRYMETLSRRLPWDGKSARAAAETSKTPSYGQSMSSTSSRYANTANVKSWSDDLSGLGPAKATGSLERDAVDQLLRPQQDTPQSIENLRLPVKSVRDYVEEFAPKDNTQTVDAERIIESTSQFSQHEDINAYKPTGPQDLDTPWEMTSEETSKHHNDLQKYRPVEWSEPDGLPSRTTEELSKDYDDLHKYGPVKWNEPDGLRPLTAEELSKKYDDLHRYSQYENSGPESARIHPEEASKNYKDLSSYEKPVLDSIASEPEFNEHDLEIRLKTAAHQSSGDNLEPVAADAPNGTIKAAAKRRLVNLEDAKQHHQNSFEADAPKGPVTEAQPIVDVELEAARRVEKLEDGKAEYAAEWGAEEHQQPPVAEQLENVAEERVAKLEADKAAHERRFEQEIDEGVSSMDESFPTGKYTVQDALNKLAAQQKKGELAAQRARAEQDPYSKIPQGLEVSYSQETGEQDSPPQAVSGVDARPAAEYVVLAFDPETQTVNVAETSSIAESLDSSSQTPAEAILRLSNPAKFFPHFKPLQSHGYEIVSGRGDVLIFRKVGQAVAGASAYDPSTVGRKKRSLGKKLAISTAAAAGAAYGVGTLAEYLSTNGLT